LAQLSDASKEIQRLGQDRLTKSGGKGFSLRETYATVGTNLNGYRLIHLDGSTDPEIESKLRGDT
jgi:hypothetical protein